MEAYSLYIKTLHTIPDFHELEPEPETICNIMKVNEEDCSKILACETALVTHHAFEQFHVFQKFCVCINDRKVDFKTHQEVTPSEVEWGVLCLRMIDPVYPFSNEVLGFIAAILYNDGLLSVPEHIARESSVSNLTVQDFLNDVNNGNKVHDHTGERAQSEIKKNISDYVHDRYQKLIQELEEFENE
jgi:hypothetical protein